MKFGNPLLTTEMSGALGGIVGSKSRGGVRYFRVRARPSNPRKFQQTVTRGVLASLAAYWTTTLTDLQRAAWRAIAGSTSSGINAFEKGNMQPLLAGEGITAAAPSSLSLTVTPMASAHGDASSHDIEFSANVGVLDEIKANVYVSAPQHASRLARQFPYLYIGTGDGDSNSVAVPPSHPAYNMTAGQVIFIRLVRYGQATGSSAGKVAIAEEFRSVVTA